MTKFDEYLASIFSSKLVEKKFQEALNYLLLNGGKRLRAQFVFDVANDLKLKQEDFFPLAAAIELVHTYSLVHDDLPALDNDDYRRGKLTTHKIYGEGIALLVGDALLTESFNQIAKIMELFNLDTKLLQEFVEIIGATKGMIHGQVLDLYNEEKSLNEKELNKINFQKTAQLFIFSLTSVALITKDKSSEKLKEIGTVFGILFQIQDDYLDYYGDFKLLGKSLKKDEKLKKTTFASLYNKEELEQLITEKYTELTSLTKDFPNVSRTIQKLLKREN